MPFDPETVAAARKAALVAAAPTFQDVALSVPGAAAVADAAAEMNTADTEVLVEIVNELDERIVEIDERTGALEGVEVPALGYQGQDWQAASAVAVASTTFIDATGFPSWGFTAPVTKTYLVSIDLTAYLGGSISNELMTFRLLNNGTPVGPEWPFIFHDNLWSLPISFRVPVSMSAGTNTLSLQWKASAGNMTTTAQEFRCFTVTG